jgi:hypothetical protein
VSNLGGAQKMTSPSVITVVVNNGLSSLKMGGEWCEKEDEFEEEENEWMRGSKWRIIVVKVGDRVT